MSGTIGEFFAVWFPLIVFIIVFVFLMRKSSKTYNKHVDDVNRVNQQIVDELREIKEILKDKK